MAFILGSHKIRNCNRSSVRQVKPFAHFKALPLMFAHALDLEIIINKIILNINFRFFGNLQDTLCELDRPQKTGKGTVTFCCTCSTGYLCLWSQQDLKLQGLMVLK